MKIGVAFLSISLMLVIFSLQSCQSDRVYSNSIDIQDEKWAYNQVLEFEWNIEDTASLYRLLLVVDHDLSIPFQNIYVRCKTVYPDQTLISASDVSLELLQENGKPYGECSTGANCKLELLLQDKARFPQLGKYKLSIQQNSRVDPYIGLKKIGLQVFNLGQKDQK